MDTLRKALEQAAAHLSGHPVRVRWRKPSRADAKALAFKSGGVAIIDLHPGYYWDGDTLLYVLCHESAHIRELYPGWMGVPDYASGSIRVSNKASNLPGVVDMELRADEQAYRWLAAAEQDCNKYARAGDDKFTAMLRTLAEMPL